jgi:hypothetical protein
MASVETIDALERMMRWYHEEHRRDDSKRFPLVDFKGLRKTGSGFREAGIAASEAQGGTARCRECASKANERMGGLMQINIEDLKTAKGREDIRAAVQKKLDSMDAERKVLVGLLNLITSFNPPDTGGWPGR